MLLLAVAAGDVIAAAGDLDVDIGHQRCPPRLEQPVDLADRALDPRAQRLMRVAQLRQLLGRSAPSARGAGGAAAASIRAKRALDPADGVKGALVGHGQA